MQPQLSTFKTGPQLKRKLIDMGLQDVREVVKNRKTGDFSLTFQKPLDGHVTAEHSVASAHEIEGNLQAALSGFAVVKQQEIAATWAARADDRVRYITAVTLRVVPTSVETGSQAVSSHQRAIIPKLPASIVKWKPPVTQVLIGSSKIASVQRPAKLETLNNPHYSPYQNESPKRGLIVTEGTLGMLHSVIGRIPQMSITSQLRTRVSALEARNNSATTLPVNAKDAAIENLTTQYTAFRMSLRDPMNARGKAFLMFAGIIRDLQHDRVPRYDATEAGTPYLRFETAVRECLKFCTYMELIDIITGQEGRA